MIQVRVADDGIGIPPEAVSSLFTPFFTTKDHGTGLGLALSHQIVTEHGGAIRVESEPGRGSVFSVTLPMIQEETPPEKPGRGAARRRREKAG
jgi:signal transduction histidine kinase